MNTIRRSFKRKAERFADDRLRDIYQAVLDAAGVSDEEMLSPTRRPGVVDARVAFTMLARVPVRPRMPVYSYPLIADALGTGHSAAMHHVKVYPARPGAVAVVRKAVESLHGLGPAPVALVAPVAPAPIASPAPRKPRAPRAKRTLP